MVIETIDNMTSNVDGLEVSFSQEESALKTILGTDEAPVVVEVRGEEMGEIENVVNEVKQRMLGMNELFNVQTSIENGAPEIEIKVDRTRAGVYNIDVANVISQLQSQLDGQDAGQLETDGEMEDIVIKVPEKGLSDIGALTITSGNQVFRLDEIATIII